MAVDKKYRAIKDSILNIIELEDAYVEKLLSESRKIHSETPNHNLSVCISYSNFVNRIQALLNAMFRQLENNP